MGWYQRRVHGLEGFGDHPVLEELHLNENQLTTLKGLGCLSKLKRLVLTGNQLASFEGLDTPRLTRLQADSNQLVSFEHIAGSPACSELNLSGNQLSNEDFMLPEIRRLGPDMPRLHTLLLAGNPLADAFGETLKIEMLVCAPQLQKVEEEEITDEDREAAKAREQELIEQAK